MVKPTNTNSDYREEERLTCVLVLDSFNLYINEIASHTSLPLCLWPIDGQPLLDYTIHTLIRSDIQEILLLATSNYPEIRSYLMNSHWLRTYPKLIRLIPCKEARSLGDCLKDLEQENIISNHFLLIYGNGTLLTNKKLNRLFTIHKENIKKDKNCVMTLVYRQLDSNHLEHPSFTDDQHSYIARDVNTHRLYDYSNEYLDTYEIPLDLLEKPNVIVETLYCPLDCHLAVCSPDVLHLFKDNFDYLTINEFVKGVLRDEEIAGHTIYSHLYETGYFLSVHNLRLYTKATFDILRRWCHPFVPEIISSMHKQALLSVTTPISPHGNPNDPYSFFYNVSHPVIYDKHNIYKQGDVQLDRLSNIQQDVFIGHKSQILSGVCLRSSLIGQNCIIGKNTRIENSIIWNHVQIGENCIIKNSIICDNVLIRNNVQIDKECVLCKGVIVGTNIHLKERTILIASTPATTATMTDDIEIDDDIQLPAADFKRSNSKQSRSSTRLSEKSFSDKSVGSSIEETITSNADIVGNDGLGRELIFTFSHDHSTRHFEPVNEDEDSDDDESDKDKLNAFDAWGCRIEPVDKKDSSFTEDDYEIKDSRYRSANIKKSATPPSNASSGSEISHGNISSSSSESGDTDDENDVSEFQEEVIRTLERAYLQKVKVENIIVELNILKPTYDVSPTEFDQSITRAVFLLPFEKKISNVEKPNYWNTLKSTLDQITKAILNNYMKTTNEQAQMTVLNELHVICLKHIQPIGERIVNILNYLYENDVITEKWILKWYENQREKIQTNELVIKPEEKIFYDKLKQFIEWLQNAESEDEDDEEGDD